MVIKCRHCGALLADITMPTFSRAEMFAIEKVLGAMSVSVPQLGKLLDPSPEAVTSFVSAQCPEGFHCAGGV